MVKDARFARSGRIISRRSRCMLSYNLAGDGFYCTIPKYGQTGMYPSPYKVLYGMN